MPIEIPYHKGELEVQSRCNATDMARKMSGLFKDSIPEGAFQFIEQQPMCVIGSADSDENVWASMIFGQPGFLYVQSELTLVIDLTMSNVMSNDILWSNVQNNQNVGLLVIDLGTRRRLRINGRARQLSPAQYVVNVERTYSNCPKYIQRRFWEKSNEKMSSPENRIACGKILNASQHKIIEKADTFFVASAHPQFGLDASHRGGFPGFVKFISNNQINILDYQGNSMFNTLGNFISYPHAGLVFLDFDSGELLQLTGIPQVIFDEADMNGAVRHWLLTIKSWRQYTSASLLEWRFQDYSPFNPQSSKE